VVPEALKPRRIAIGQKLVANDATIEGVKAA
jgi:hypothetical protein